MAQSKIEKGLAEIANLQEGNERTILETALKNLRAALQKRQAGPLTNEDTVI